MTDRKTQLKSVFRFEKVKVVRKSPPLAGSDSDPIPLIPTHKDDNLKKSGKWARVQTKAAIVNRTIRPS